MAESRALKENEVDSLIASGDAMVGESTEYTDMVAVLGGQIAGDTLTIEDACRLLVGG